MKRKLIFAGNHSQAGQYAQEHNLSPSDYAVVSDIQHVVGLTPDDWTVVTIGDWWKNDSVARVYAYLRSLPRWHAVIGEAGGDP